MKTKNTLLVIAGILLALLTIKTCKLENELQTSNGQLQTLIYHPVTKTDTVWETKIIQPPKELPNEVKPAKVTLPKESQSLGGYNPGQGISEENLEKTGMPAISPRDSLIGIDLNKSKFTLTFNNPNFGNHTSQFNIKPNEYHYTWVNGKLTAERLPFYKRLEFKPYTSLSYRPIHNLWDWDLGISFKTKSLNYNLGVNAFYYPKFQKDPGLDIQLRITYNF